PSVGQATTETTLTTKAHPNQGGVLPKLKATGATTLTTETTKAPVLDIPLTVFAREGRPVHLEVPGLLETIWFVPIEADAGALQAEGVRRGRVWTAVELQELMRLPGLATDDAVTIARVRLAFNATVLPGSDEREPEKPADSSACRACHGRRFW